MAELCLLTIDNKHLLNAVALRRGDSGADIIGLATETIT